MIVPVGGGGCIAGITTYLAERTTGTAVPVVAVVNEGDFHAENLKIACWALIDMGIGVAQWFSPDGDLTAEELGEMYGQFALRQLT